MVSGRLGIARSTLRRLSRICFLLSAVMLFSGRVCLANGPEATPSIFAPVSTPADNVFDLSLFVIGITAGIFVVVGGLGAYAVVKYRRRDVNDTVEPAQIFGSTQVELAWTVVPVIIVVVLFLTTARYIFAVQDNPEPQDATDVTLVGHQFWWEFRYPKYGFVAANELHVPLSDPRHPTPTYIKETSADVIHSYWIPQLAGKTDAIPNHVNTMWIDPHAPGMYVGQCGQFCGAQHAKMLARVYVDTPQQFAAWVKNQQLPAVHTPDASDGVAQESLAAKGQRVFQEQSCVNCHEIRGTAAAGKFGPDLTHFASRDTLASSAYPNTPEYLKTWIRNPDDLKPGALMPAMQLTGEQYDQLVAYLETLK